jgi:serine/threonine protein kinase
VSKKKKKFGRWESIRTIGEGGQAQVYLVKDSDGLIPGTFALKPLAHIHDEERRTRFLREVEATQAIEHPNILHIYESDVAAERPYYVAEYCDGRSLEHVGAGRFKANIKATLDILLPVLDALVSAHRKGVYHRDVKPPNILFRSDGTPVLGDFGICYIDDGTPMTLSIDAMGSRRYIAPEMEAGRHHLGPPCDRTDVYSFGKVLYWMLSGGRIFDREDHRTPNNSLVQLLGDQRWEHVNALLDKLIVETAMERLHSHKLKEELQMAESLVAGNYAPLTPSVGIKCRFCGIGNYEKYATSGRLESGLIASHELRNKLGWENVGTIDVRVLRCSHCGHIEAFQFDGITAHDWWTK